jgi:hypothetical protein
MITRWMPVVIGGLAVAALAVTGGILGRGMAAEIPGPGPYLAQAHLAELWPEEFAARFAAPVDYGTAPARLGVTQDFARESALSMLEVASSVLDPQSLLQPTSGPGPRDECVAVTDRPEGCPLGLNSTVLPTDPAVLLTARAPGPAECDLGRVLVAASAVAEVTVSWWTETEPIRTLTAPVAATPSCVELPGLSPATRYGVHVQLGDQFRRFVLDSGGQALRPSASVYAPTPDLIAVTVPHRPGESVRVFQNVLSGSEPHCDEVTVGYDLFVHPLGSVHGTLTPEVLETAGYDPAFTERTTFAFDIGEGHTVFLCAIVTTASGDEDYSAQTIVATADRVTPVVRVLQASVPGTPDWQVSATLANGQACGAWVPGQGELGDLAFPNGERPVLCDPSDELGSQVDGRGVLPYSTARPTSLTVQLGSAQWGRHTAAIDLGEGARCTGRCVPPATSYVEIADDRGGSAMLEVVWGQGTTNGASVTEVSALTDSLSVPLPGPLLDVATARSVVVSGDDETRGVIANLYIRADGEVGYTARLVPAAGEEECSRPGARLELSGRLAEVRPVDRGIIEPGEWSEIGNLRFSGLCHGTVYQAIVELTDGEGRTTIWGDGSDVTSWHVSSELAIPPLTVRVDIGFVVTGHPSGGGSYLSIFLDGVRVLGPIGGCLRGEQEASGSFPADLLLGETSRLSGFLVLQPADTSGRGCLPRPIDAGPAVPFAVELNYDQLQPGNVIDFHIPGADIAIAVPGG